jgi:iron complex outermembrane receptor protein
MLMAFIADISAQTIRDTTLSEIKVRGKHNVSGDMRVNELSPGQKVTTIDSVTLQQYQLQSLANLLAQQVPVFIKSYGFNGLSTLNFRGSSSAQSQVLWNGIPIQNAALGIADVSTLPVLFMNKVNIVYGGSAALYGSGNVGGALLLENNAPAFDTGLRSLSVSGGVGSFSQYRGGIKGSIATKRWYFSANIFAQTALNDFSYTNALGVKETMTNSKLKSNAAMLQAAYKVTTQDVINLTAWFQQYDRLIPPALFESSSDKREIDGSLRSLAEWHRRTDKNEWYAKSSFMRDEMNYSYEAVALHWDYITYQYYQEIGWKHRFNKFGQFLLFMPVQLSWIRQPDSNSSKQQNKAAIAGAYEFRLLNNKLDIAINARTELISQLSDTTIRNFIFLPGADASFLVTDWLGVRVNVQRTYRAPTLNELYYYPGGNKFLRPEQGWNEDVGYTMKAKFGRFSIFHDVSVYNRNIHDWIIWLGGAIWTPHNISEVHSRGVETENNINYTTGNWKLHIGVNTSYVLATTVTSYIYNDGSLGKQIPYTPRYNGQANIGFSYKSFYVNYNHTYTGYRFITTDESAYVTPYQTGNVQLMYNTSIHTHTLQFIGQCNNIWNDQYQVVNGRPMPGLNWQGGFKVGIF